MTTPDAAGRERDRVVVNRPVQACPSFLSLGGKPESKAIPSTPGKRRWDALTTQAKQLLQLAYDEMQESLDNHSEAWQEGPKGQELQERLDSLDEAIGVLEEILGTNPDE